MPLREAADIYVMTDASITYLNDMLNFLAGKGLKVHYYNPGCTYLPSDIILLPYKPSVMPSQFTFVITNNKRDVWNFLKSSFALRNVQL